MGRTSKALVGWVAGVVLSASACGPAEDSQGALLANESGTVEQAAVAAPGDARTYQVRRGDTLTYIAQTYCMSVETLVELNQLDPAAILPTGKLLKLPPAQPIDAQTEAVADAMSNGTEDNVKLFLEGEMPGNFATRDGTEAFRWDVKAYDFGDAITRVTIRGACVAMLNDVHNLVGRSWVLGSEEQGLKFEDLGAHLRDAYANLLAAQEEMRQAALTPGTGEL